MAQMGRPRAFDRDAAIEQAMLLFWQNGYESTSLSQLKAEIGGGISAPSFYAAFGSKEGLFNEAAERYTQTYGQVTNCLFDLDLTPRDAIETALHQSAQMQCDSSHPLGCMVALGTMGSCATDDNPLAISRARTRAGFLACVERGIGSGELAADTPAQALATVFESFLVGVSPLARDGVPLAVIEAAIAPLMGVWDSAAERAGFLE